MALKPMLDETPPKGPSPEEQLEQERQARARAEQEFRERQAAYEARLDEMARTYGRPAPTPPPAAPEPTQPELTPEDIQKDPDRALQMLEDHIRTKAVAEASQAIEQKYGGLVGSLSNQAVNVELASLKDKRYWAEAETDVTRYFEDNPQELRPGRVSEVFNYVVGANLDRYEEQAKQRVAQDAATAGYQAPAASPSSAETPIRRSTPREPEEDKASAEPTLSEEEELVRQEFNKHGANISAKEWVAISSGKIFPKKRGADWDAGYYKEGRDISRYEG